MGKKNPGDLMEFHRIKLLVITMFIGSNEYVLSTTISYGDIVMI